MQKILDSLSCIKTRLKREIYSKEEFVQMQIQIHELSDMVDDTVKLLDSRIIYAPDFVHKTRCIEEEE